MRKFSVVYLKMPTKNTGMMSRMFRVDNAERIPDTEEVVGFSPAGDGGVLLPTFGVLFELKKC